MDDPMIAVPVPCEMGERKDNHDRRRGMEVAVERDDHRQRNTDGNKE